MVNFHTQDTCEYPHMNDMIQSNIASLICFKVLKHCLHMVSPTKKPLDKMYKY